jgi:hypothetical protein
MKQRNCTPDIRINQVKIAFTPKPITAWGGIATLIAKFFEVIKLREWVERIIPFAETSPNGKGIYEKVLGHFLTVLCGGVRFSHLQWWHHGHEALCRVFGVSWLPQAASTLTRFWGKFFLQRHAEEIGHQCRGFAGQLLEHEGITYDDLNLDSSVVSRYGVQDGARKGYNPRKPGRPSHHPLFAFLGSGYVVNLWNRSGDSHSSHRSIEFFEQTIAALDPDFIVSMVLGDSGFYDVHFLEYLEDNDYQYIIAVRLHQTIQHQIALVSEWTLIEPGLSVAEFPFEHHDEKWVEPRRYVVVRQEIASRPKATGRQLSLFPDTEEWQEYRFAVFITNNEIDTPHEIWQSYRPRANDENVIKDLKEGYGFASFNVKSFWATESVMVMNALVIHNLIHYLNRNVLNKKKPQPQLKTIRLKYFILPAILGREARYSVLRLSVQQKEVKEKLCRMLTAIENISLRVNCIAV